MQAFTVVKLIPHKILSLALITWRFEIVYNGKMLAEFKDDSLCRYDSVFYVKNFLRRIGFEIEQVYGNYDFVSYQPESGFGNIIVVARTLKG